MGAAGIWHPRMLQPLQGTFNTAGMVVHPSAISLHGTGFKRQHDAARPAPRMAYSP